MAEFLSISKFFVVCLMLVMNLFSHGRGSQLGLVIRK